MTAGTDSCGLQSVHAGIDGESASSGQKPAPLQNIPEHDCFQLRTRTLNPCFVLQISGTRRQLNDESVDHDLTCSTSTDVAGPAPIQRRRYRGLQIFSSAHSAERRRVTASQSMY